MVSGLEADFLVQNFLSITVWMERQCFWNQPPLESVGCLQRTWPQGWFKLGDTCPLVFFPVSWPLLLDDMFCGCLLLHHLRCSIGLWCTQRSHFPRGEEIVQALTWETPARFMNKSAWILYSYSSVTEKCKLFHCQMKPQLIFSPLPCGHSGYDFAILDIVVYVEASCWNQLAVLLEP